jgi:hypothetical protein
LDQKVGFALRLRRFVQRPESAAIDAKPDPPKISRGLRKNGYQSGAEPFGRDPSPIVRVRSVRRGLKIGCYAVDSTALGPAAAR